MGFEFEVSGVFLFCVALFLFLFLPGGGVFDTWLYTMVRFDTDRLSRGVGSEKLIEIGSSV